MLIIPESRSTCSRRRFDASAWPSPASPMNSTKSALSCASPLNGCARISATIAWNCSNDGVIRIGVRPLLVSHVRHRTSNNAFFPNCQIEQFSQDAQVCIASGLTEVECRKESVGFVGDVRYVHRSSAGPFQLDRADNSLLWFARAGLNVADSGEVIFAELRETQLRCVGIDVLELVLFVL